MGQVLYSSARTTAAIRRAIQHSRESLRGLAVSHGINPKTVARWRKRPGPLLAQYGPVDELSYAYDGNRLCNVQDAVRTNQLPRPTGCNGAPTSLAGGFQEAGVRLGTEYYYDNNGSMTQDKNKGITAIV